MGTSSYFSVRPNPKASGSTEGLVQCSAAHSTVHSMFWELTCSQCILGADLFLFTMKEDKNQGLILETRARVLHGDLISVESKSKNCLYL